MKVVIDDDAGFCFGVVNAINTAEKALTSRQSLYCLGDIVHNNAEVTRLTNLGMRVIDHCELQNLQGVDVLIRAHGEPPSTYRVAKDKSIRLIDATCPIVLNLQKQIREGYETMRKCNGQVVIFGKKGHAEVIGLNGQTENTAIIISSIDDISSIDCSRPIRLYAQTTQNKALYRQLAEKLQASGCPDLVVFNTLCSRVGNRAKQSETFAMSVDCLLFVCGQESSNGRYLYEYCHKVQPQTYMITGSKDIQPQWLVGKSTIGITGATSTPRWLMEEVKQYVETLPLN